MDRARTSAADPAVFESDNVRAVLLGNPEADRRIEDWIVSRVEGAPDRQSPTTWPGRVDVTNPTRTRPVLASIGERQGWKRIKVEQHGDVTIVHVLDSQLLGEGPIAELRGELRELCEAGCARIVLSAVNVDRISSQFLEILASLDRHCSRMPGGRLKLCKVGPEVSRILELSGLDRQIEVVADLSVALGGPWPKGPRRVPIEIFGELNRRSTPEVSEPTSPVASSSDEVEVPEAAAPPGVSLVVTREGKPLGVLPIPSGGLRIGREAPCEVRVRNRAVSRSHAWIGERGGRWKVEDLGSTNGTMVDGQPLHSSTVSVRVGSSIEIGPYRFALSDASAPIVEEILSEWTAEPDAEPSSPLPFPSDLEGAQDARKTLEEGDQELRFEEVEGVLVVTPTFSRLEDEDRINAVRERLDSLIHRPDPYRKLVLNLAPLVVLSGRMIGVLLAYHLRVQRIGGSLRLTQATAPVATAMDLVGLPLLVETFPTIEEAVLSRWPE